MAALRTIKMVAVRPRDKELAGRCSGKADVDDSSHTALDLSVSHKRGCFGYETTDRPHIKSCMTVKHFLSH